jgi:hypothetical protein
MDVGRTRIAARTARVTWAVNGRPCSTLTGAAAARPIGVADHGSTVAIQVAGLVADLFRAALRVRVTRRSTLRVGRVGASVSVAPCVVGVGLLFAAVAPCVVGVELLFAAVELLAVGLRVVLYLVAARVALVALAVAAAEDIQRQAQHHQPCAQAAQVHSQFTEVDPAQTNNVLQASDSRAGRYSPRVVPHRLLRSWSYATRSPSGPWTVSAPEDCPGDRREDGLAPRIDASIRCLNVQTPDDFDAVRAAIAEARAC